MHGLNTPVVQALFSAFLGVLFLQSGLDKVLDWKGNKAYIGSVFEKTPLRRLSTLMLFAVTVLEVSAGVFSAAGTVATLLGGERALGLIGAFLSAVALVSLFFGQRIAKDYAGAAGLVPYFLVAMAALTAYASN